MPIQALGHAVLKVRDLDRAQEFYHGVLGLPIATRSEDLKMLFFTLGNHHDFAVRAVGADAPDPDPRAPGLFHVAFKVGDSMDELREWKQRLDERGIPTRAVDHQVSKSLYLTDPDGNGIELYIDADPIWKEKPEAVAQGRPLAI